MRLLLTSLTLALIVAFTPTGTAGALGQLDSDAPVELFGEAFAGGSDLWLYHHGFEPGSFTGILYGGSIVDVETHSVNCGGGAPYRETVRPLASVSSSTPDPISFTLDKDGVAIVDLGDEARAPAGAGDPLAAEEPDALPAALVGPNPHVIDDAGSAADYPPEFVRVFPLDPFIVIPTTALNMPFTGSVVVEIGNLTITQAGRDRTFTTATTTEPSDCLPNVPVPQPTRDVYHRIEIRAETAVLTVKQGPLDRTRAWYDGTLKDEATPSAGPDGAASVCASEPRGHVMRQNPQDVRRIDHACALPATLYSSVNLTAYVEGLATFEKASGIVAAGYEDKQIEAQDITLTGNLDLTPAAVEESGRRMRTDIDGAVFQVNSPEAAAPKDEWQAYAAGAAGGALLFGVFLYTWPMVKWRFAAFAVPLYARLKKNEVLENPLRDDILAHVQETPGISASELGRRVECGWGTLVYHLTVLERMQLVSSAREGRHKRFFAQGRINYSDKGAVGLLANAAARTILDAIRQSPGTIQKDLSVQLNLSPGTVAWHVERLAAEGLVIKEDEGRTVRYYPSERLLQLTQRLAA